MQQKTDAFASDLAPRLAESAVWHLGQVQQKSEEDEDEKSVHSSSSSRLGDGVSRSRPWGRREEEDRLRKQAGKGSIMEEEEEEEET